MEYAEDFVLLSATFYRHEEFLLRFFRQKTAFWLDYEENNLYVAVYIDFNSAHILFKEAVSLVIALEAY